MILILNVFVIHIIHKRICVFKVKVNFYGFIHETQLKKLISR